MKLLSLFSGIGAFEKALDKLNIPYELVNYCDIDKFASKSYSLIHSVSEDKNLWDITKVDEKKLPKDIDLITYGFPCQDISLAGKQKGLFNEDGTSTRSGLFFEALRIIEETKPRYAIAENVKNLTSKKFRTEFEIVLNSLEEAGYNNYWQVLNAKHYGIPQNRERVFIISVRKDIDNGFDFPKPFELKLRLKDMLEDVVDEKYFLSDKMIKYITAIETTNFKNPNCKINLDIARCDLGLLIKEKTKKGYAIACEGDGVYINRPHQKRGVVQKNIIQTIKTSASDVGVVVAENRFFKQAFNTLKANECNEGDTINAFNQSVDKSGIAPTLTTRPEGFKTAILLITKELKIRKLTPLECWRLMGFSDYDYEKASKVNSNTQLYKQAGNSIVVNVLEEIFKNLLLEGSKKKETLVFYNIFDFLKEEKEND